MDNITRKVRTGMHCIKVGVKLRKNYVLLSLQRGMVYEITKLSEEAKVKFFIHINKERRLMKSGRKLRTSRM